MVALAETPYFLRSWGLPVGLRKPCSRNRQFDIDRLRSNAVASVDRITSPLRRRGRFCTDGPLSGLSLQGFQPLGHRLISSRKLCDGIAVTFGRDKLVGSY